MALAISSVIVSDLERITDDMIDALLYQEESINFY
jgi:hypothetical protein